MKKRVGDVEEFGFEPLTDDPDVHVTIAVTGWLTEDEPGTGKCLQNHFFFEN